MIASVLAVIALFALAAAPGLLLSRSWVLPPAGSAAIGAASIAITSMTTALIAIAAYTSFGAALPAWSIAPVSLLLSLAAWLVTRDDRWRRPCLEWQAIGVVLFLLVQGYVIHSLAITELPDGSMRVHAFYNADWFKHIGYVFGIADYGLPARDIFGGGRPLHYYWLSHILPGAATALGGDAWAALYTANALYVGLLGLTLYGVIRLPGTSPNMAAAIGSLATTICAIPTVWAAVFSPGLREQLMFGDAFPPEPAFASLALYLPQHAFALSLLLSWAILALNLRKNRRAPHVLGLAGLATVMTVSILFGVAILATYGFTELYRRRLQALPELLAMAALSIALVIVLSVFQIDDPTGSYARPDSPRIDPASGIDLLRAAFAAFASPVEVAGIPFYAMAFFAVKWKPKDAAGRNALVFALCATISALLCAGISQVLVGGMIAGEVRLRTMNLLAVAIGIIGGWAANEGWTAGRKGKAVTVAALSLLVAAAAPTIWFRAIWYAKPQDRYTTIIPTDDRAVLDALRKNSAPRDIVWQYPENTVLSDAGGNDSWSAVIAGRTDITSLRATEFTAASPTIELAKRYFAGENVPVPQEARWIYLSRKLHPASYGIILARLATDPKWMQAACRADACLFKRRS